MRTWVAAAALMGLAACSGSDRSGAVRFAGTGSPEAVVDRIREGQGRCWSYDDAFRYFWGYTYWVEPVPGGTRIDFGPAGSLVGRPVRLSVEATQGEGGTVVEAWGRHLRGPEARGRIAADLQRWAAGEAGCGPDHVPMNPGAP